MTKPRKATPEDLARVARIQRSARTDVDPVEQGDDGAQQPAATPTAREARRTRPDGPASDA